MTRLYKIENGDPWRVKNEKGEEEFLVYRQEVPPLLRDIFELRDWGDGSSVWARMGIRRDAKDKRLIIDHFQFVRPSGN